MTAAARKLADELESGSRDDDEGRVQFTATEDALVVAALRAYGSGYVGDRDAKRYQYMRNHDMTLVYGNYVAAVLNERECPSLDYLIDQRSESGQGRRIRECEGDKG